MNFPSGRNERPAITVAAIAGLCEEVGSGFEPPYKVLQTFA